MHRRHRPCRRPSSGCPSSLTLLRPGRDVGEDGFRPARSPSLGRASAGRRSALWSALGDVQRYSDAPRRQGPRPRRARRPEHALAALCVRAAHVRRRRRRSCKLWSARPTFVPSHKAHPVPLQGTLPPCSVLHRAHNRTRAPKAARQFPRSEVHKNRPIDDEHARQPGAAAVPLSLLAVLCVVLLMGATHGIEMLSGAPRWAHGVACTTGVFRLLGLLRLASHGCRMHVVL